MLIRPLIYKVRLGVVQGGDSVCSFWESQRGAVQTQGMARDTGPGMGMCWVWLRASKETTVPDQGGREGWEEMALERGRGRSRSTQTQVRVVLALRWKDRPSSNPSSAGAS